MLMLKQKMMALFIFGGLAGAGFVPVAGGEGPVTLLPPPAALICPGQGEVVQGPIMEKKFLWSVVDQARSYHLELATDRDFLSIKKNLYPGNNSHTFKYLPAGTYFWRVSSLNAEGLEGRYSSVQYFIYPAPE